MSNRKASRILLTLVMALAVSFLTLIPGVSAAPTPGAIFTTNSTCDGTNINIYSSKDAVYLDGGPAHPGAAGLPDGEYYVQVTAPDGTLLGTSLGTGDETPAVVVGGEFQSCYQLSAILIKASDSTPGYDDTPNPGGEYKVWASAVSTFNNGDGTKTDNFKVKCLDCDPEPPQGTLNVIKFYDANANGINDDGQLITGWRISIQDGMNYIRDTPVSITVDPDDYVVTEADPIETSWRHTTPNPVNITLHDGEDPTVEFGNLCLGAGGGLTLGFWSNKNGAKVITGPPNRLPGVLSLCLRNADGSLLGSVSLGNFQKFLLNASATNMANMLSAQLAAMHLNVASGGVNGSALIYAPGATGANSLGYATVNQVIAEASAELCAHGYTVSGDPFRNYQESLKNALDKANNNLNFVQATPCPFTFAPLP